MILIDDKIETKGDIIKLLNRNKHHGKDRELYADAVIDGFILAKKYCGDISIADFMTLVHAFKEGEKK